MIITKQSVIGIVSNNKVTAAFPFLLKYKGKLSVGRTCCNGRRAAMLRVESTIVGLLQSLATMSVANKTKLKQLLLDDNVSVVIQGREVKL